MKYLVFCWAALVVLSVQVPARAGWGTCPAPQLAAQQIQTTPAGAWYFDAAPWTVYRKNDFPGRWDYSEKLWYPWDDGAQKYLAPVTVAPLPLPEVPAELRKKWAIQAGVCWDRIHDAPRYQTRDGEISRERAAQMVEDAITDDSKKLRITVIGADAAQRSAALQTIGHPDWAVVTSWPADDWHVHDYGFVCSGKPTVYIQNAAGKVIHRQDDLIGLEIALRRADPNYDPANDPDLRTGTSPSLPAVSGSNPLWIGAAGGAVLLLLIYGVFHGAKALLASARARRENMAALLLKISQLESMNNVSSAS